MKNMFYLFWKQSEYAKWNFTTLINWTNPLQHFPGPDSTLGDIKSTIKQKKCIHV